MDKAWQEMVRERAYALWEREQRPADRAEEFWLRAEEELLAERAPDDAWTEAMVDKALEQTFPASDPPAWTP